MQDSPDQSMANEAAKQARSLPDLGLGRLVYARHLGFPSASPVGAGIASRFAWFGSDNHLPLAGTILQRWSTAEGSWQGPPSLHWLGRLTSTRKVRAASVSRSKVTNIQPASEGSVNLAVADETHQAFPLAAGTANIVNEQKKASEPLQLLLSRDHESSQKQAGTDFTWGEKASTPVGTQLPNHVAPIDHSANAASASTARRQSAATNVGSPLVYSVNKKSGNINKSGSTSKVWSMISEAGRSQASRIPASSSKGETHNGEGAASTSVSPNRDIQFPINMPSAKKAHGVDRNEGQRKEATQVEGTVHSGEPPVGLKASHEPQTARPESISRAVEPSPTTPVFIGPPIFHRSLNRTANRSVKGIANIAPPGNVSRSQEEFHNSETFASAARGVPAVSRGEPSSEHGAGGRESASRAAERSVSAPALGGIRKSEVDLKKAGSESGLANLKPVSNAALNGAVQLASAGNFGAIHEPQQVSETPFNNKVETFPVTKSPELANEAPPALGGLQRSIGFAASRIEAVAPVRREHLNPASEVHRNRQASTLTSQPAPIQTQSLNGEKPLATAEETHSRTQNPSASESAAMDATIARSLDPARITARRGDQPATAFLSPSSSDGAGTPVFLDSLSQGKHEVPHSTTLSAVEPRMKSGRDKTEIPSVAAYPAVFPEGLSSSYSSVRVSRAGDQTDEIEGATRAISRFSAASSSSAGLSTAKLLNRSADANPLSTTPRPLVAPTRTEISRIPAEGKSMNFVIPVWRAGKHELPGHDWGDPARKAAEANDNAIGEDTVKARRSSTERESNVTAPTMDLARSPEGPVRRQSPLPIELPGLRPVVASRGFDRVAALPPSESIHRSPVRVGDSPKDLYRSSLFTHRSFSGVEHAHRAADPSLVGRNPSAHGPAAISAPLNVNHAYPLIARAAASPVTAPVPPPPAVTNSSKSISGMPQGFKKTEIAQLANRVYDLLVRRLADERQRRGQ